MECLYQYKKEQVIRIKYVYILNFVVTPRNFTIAILLFAIIKLRGVTTKFKKYFFTMQTFKELIKICLFTDGFDHEMSNDSV